MKEKKKFKLVAEKEERVDVFLSQELGYTRSKVKSLFENGSIEIFLNRKKVRLSTKTKKEDLVEVFLFDEKNLVKESFPELKIVFDNKEFFVIDKPSGIPTTRQKEEVSVAKILSEKKMFSLELEKLFPRWGGVVHRLDKYTKGLILCAKNMKTYLKLKELFKERKIQKIYEAICVGDISPNGTINASLEKFRNKVFISRSVEAKEAITSFELIAKKGKFNFVRIFPKTGRTHQIRVHFSSINAPILGDKYYGNNSVKFEELCLVAKELSFNFNDKEYKIESGYGLQKVFDGLEV